MVGANNVLYSRDYGFSSGAAWTWVNHGYVGSVWQSTDHGYPPGTSSNTQGIGTLAVASGNNQFPYAFVIANDGSLESPLGRH